MNEATVPLYVLGSLYVAATTVFIVMENRRPQATFAWMLLFFSFPIVGVLVYLLFGRDRRTFSRERKLVRQDLLSDVARELSPLRPQHENALMRMEEARGPAGALARLVRHTAHSAVTTGNRLEVLQDASTAYPRLIEDIRQAKVSIHLQFFIWASDAFGERLKEELLAKVAEGVEVRILFDPVGSFFRLRRRYLKEMREGGVCMEPHSAIWRLHTIGYRNHRKIAVIDGTIGQTGGLNIGLEHLDGGPVFSRWRDTQVRVVGPAASLLQAAFIIDWRNAVGEDLLAPKYFPPPAPVGEPSVPVQLTLSGPDSQWEAIRQLYFSMIVAAKGRVFVQSPFFILDESITAALQTAALKGVRVRIMLSERGFGQVVPYWAGFTYMQEIAAAGAEIFLYRGGYLHSKTISIDGEICSIGSANIDIRSFSINYELNAVIYDPVTALELEQAFERDLQSCVRFTPEEYRRRSPILRFRDSVARLFSPLL